MVSASSIMFCLCFIILPKREEKMWKWYCVGRCNGGDRTLALTHDITTPSTNARQRVHFVWIIIILNYIKWHCSRNEAKVARCILRVVCWRRDMAPRLTHLLFTFDTLLGHTLFRTNYLSLIKLFIRHFSWRFVLHQSGAHTAHTLTHTDRHT